MQSLLVWVPPTCGVYRNIRHSKHNSSTVTQNKISGRTNACCHRVLVRLLWSISWRIWMFKRVFVTVLLVLDVWKTIVFFFFLTSWHFCDTELFCINQEVSRIFCFNFIPAHFDQIPARKKTANSIRPSLLATPRKEFFCFKQQFSCLKQFQFLWSTISPSGKYLDSS